MTELHVPLWGENELKPWLQNKILVIFRECNGIGDSKFPMIIPVIAFPVPFTDCIPWGGERITHSGIFMMGRHQ